MVNGRYDYDSKYIIGTQIDYAKTKYFISRSDPDFICLECGTNQDETNIKSRYYQTTGFHQKKKLSHSQN